MKKEYYGGLCLTFLPHLLGFYDLDRYSASQGYGDRLHWGWKLKDFNNGAMQAGIYPLTLAYKYLPYFENKKERALESVKQIIRGIGSLQHANGSLDEAFPYEYAYSVSSTVAFDLVMALELLEPDLTEAERREFWAIADKLVRFISTAREEHGFISNHLAAAVAAMMKYTAQTGTAIPRTKELLQEILERQSSEGWYLEYEGPDPGYQTLCTYCLAHCYRLSRDERLLESLASSLDFLSYFIHPDGTLGGEYGSRNTETPYVGGFELLSEAIPVAGAIGDRLYRSVCEDKTVTLRAMDVGNFVPFYENYLVAYLESTAGKDEQNKWPLLPCEQEHVERFFPEARILVYGTPRYYAIVSAAKGGVTKVFDKKRRQPVWDDCGYVGKLEDGTYISTQNYDATANCEWQNNVLRLKADFFKMLRDAPSPWQFVVLRILNLTVMRNIAVGNLIKRMLVKLLITGKKRYSVQLERRISFSDDRITVEDHLTKSPGVRFRWLEYGHKFSAIHMASARYFQSQHLIETLKPNELDVGRFNTENSLTVVTTIAV